MHTEYANSEVLQFYRNLPFNYYGDAKEAAKRIRKVNSVEYYPGLPPMLEQGLLVLDVGCGAGWFVNRMNYYYGKHGTKVSGVDFNSVALAQAREVASILKIYSDFTESDLFKYKPAHLFDLVTSMGVLHHTNDCVAGVRHICRHCVKKGGQIFIGLYHTYGRAPFLEHFEKLKEHGASEEALNEEFLKLRSGSGDHTHNLSWFYDQVLHPHETQHTLEEMMEILDSEGMELTSTSINKFQPIDNRDKLIPLERSYQKLAEERLAAGVYFPGFFIFQAEKK